MFFFETTGSVLLSGFVESFDIDDDLSAFSSNSTVHNLRNQYKGDIVVLLTAAAYPGVAGKAKRIAARNANAYCIVELPSAAGAAMTGAHEIAHLIGARHQRCVVCLMGGCDPLTNHHGYLVGTAFRTIMVQQGCGSGARTRIGRFSNPDAPFMGFDTGNYWNKNAKKIRNRAGKVACFRESPDYSSGGNGQAYILTSIDGPSTVPNCQGYYPYTSTVSQPYQAPLTYKWEISPIGVGNWTVVSTSSSYVLTNPTNWPNFWMTLRLTVTDANGWTGFSFKEIQRVSCLDDGGDDRTIAPIDNTITHYPNPVRDILTLQKISADSQVSIFDSKGIQVRDFATSQEKENQQVLSLARLYPGVYWLTVKNTHQTFTFKFVKL
ncbi:MAG: zinc-dependent metalloprotease [Saprospiraceae bacterium]|nr:zinc-dependent metalloprotease [Saprospiraceae bacterium]